MSSARKPVLVLRALGLGDLLTAVPAVRALRRTFPARPLVLAAPAWLAPVADRVGCVDELIPAGPLRPLPARVRGAHLGVNLHGRGPQSHAVLAAAAPERLIAFRHSAVPWSQAGPCWRSDEHEVVRWCRLLDHFGIPADPSDLRIERPADDRDPELTVVHPGAASAARRWPAERFAAVARSERLRGRRVLVTGSGAEARLCRQVAAEAGLSPPSGVVPAAGLDRLMAVVAAAGRLVCGDTGPAHLATALGTPSVVLFGPTPPARWGALADRTIHREIWAGAEGDPHAGRPDPGLLQIDVDRVVDELEALELTGSPAPAG